MAASKSPAAHFRFCPRCATPVPSLPVGSLRCDDCGFVYFFNPASAVAAFIRRSDDRVLFIRRANAPARGKLAIPGGFIDIGETAEQALHRETQEEVGLRLTSLQFLCSHPNQYAYKAVRYPVLDLFFLADTDETGAERPLDGVSSLHWLELPKIDPKKIAFDSMRHAVRFYLQTQSLPSPPSTRSGPKQ